MTTNTVTLTSGKTYTLKDNSDKTIDVSRKGDDGSPVFVAKLPAELVPHLAKFTNDSAILPDFAKLVADHTPDFSELLGRAGDKVKGALSGAKDAISGAFGKKS